VIEKNTSLTVCSISFHREKGIFMAYRYSSLRSHLNKLPLEDKRVLLRADCNVPVQNGKIENDFRLAQLLETLNYIIEKKGKLIIATHLGRPKNNEPQFSTRQLLPWFAQHNLDAVFSPSIKEAKKSDAPITLLENLRFFTGETERDRAFAQELASCGDYYVNDAFGTAHRDHASLTLTPNYFSAEKRTIGFLIEREIKALNKLIDKPKLPFLVFLGGNKIETKLPLITSLISEKAFVFLMPPLVFTFLKAQNKQVGKSLIDETQISQAKKILDDPLLKEQLLFPVDYLIAKENADGPLSYCELNKFPPDAYGISIGPKTVANAKEKIARAKSLFFNAASGFRERPQTVEGTHEILKAIAQSNAYTVVGGGDSVEYAFDAGVAEKITFLSTGGGATLAYLSKKDLPGLDPFILSPEKI
jgi:phosphoglycerate kinase